jgi:hypothetical protein
MAQHFNISYRESTPWFWPVGADATAAGFPLPGCLRAFASSREPFFLALAVRHIDGARINAAGGER